MQIQFLGAADCVTGSRHRVTLGGQRILLDCGMYQGYKVLRERNWAAGGLDPKALDAVVLSHAHLDHSGWLPVLAARGWRGPVYCTAATRDLAAVLLRDAAHLQEEDARRANRHGYSRHAKALPLFTQADARRVVALMVPRPTGRAFSIGGVQATLWPAGHLLGASSVTLQHRGEQLAYSGDLGRQHDLLMPPPTPLAQADVLLVESTYGNRRHPHDDAEQRLGDIVRTTVAGGGSVLLPAFAVGRAQALLVLLQRLKRRGVLPANLPIVLDSPMAVEATGLYRHHRALLRLPAREVQALCDGVRMVATAQQSMRLAGSRWPMVIISASGMAAGGRVLHHLKTLAPQPQHHIVLAGFQVAGTRGARLAAGATEVKIHGEMVPVRARVSQLEGLSGHADADELMQWLRALRTPPRQVFVVHGEPEASDTLRARIQQELGWPARVPSHGEEVTV